MNLSLSFIRLLFISLCTLFAVTYTSTITNAFNTTTVVIGAAAGLIFSLILIGIDFIFKRWNLRSFNTALLGLFCGYLMGQAFVFIFTTMLQMTGPFLSSDSVNLLKVAILLSSIYFGITLAIRSTEELYVSIPFIRFKAVGSKKKDVVVDWTILSDSRIYDLASSGLLDDHLIIPRFMLKELYVMLESGDEGIKNKARRCLEVFKKLESIPTLDLRYSETDFPDIKDVSIKIMQLAQLLDANVITSDVSRLQQCAVEGVRIISIHMLSNALKPIAGEQLNIKVQRYGKEPRQGVGYLEDGTMVVVNGGAEYIGESIKAHVLSVKHTSSGRMIFCNVAEDAFLNESNVDEELDLENPQKNYLHF